MLEKFSQMVSRQINRKWHIKHDIWPKKINEIWKWKRFFKISSRIEFQINRNKSKYLNLFLILSRPINHWLKHPWSVMSKKDAKDVSWQNNMNKYSNFLDYGLFLFFLQICNVKNKCKTFIYGSDLNYQ